MEQLRSCPGNYLSFSIFKEKILLFLQLPQNFVYNCHNPNAINLITIIRLGFCNLQEHKFKHSFQDLHNPLCNYCRYVEPITDSFLDCPFFINKKSTFLRIKSSTDTK